MHYPDSRWRPRCQGKSRDDVSGRIVILCDTALNVDYSSVIHWNYAVVPNSRLEIVNLK